MIIGAGFSGICMGIKLKKLGVPFKILEREGGVGGTWLKNTYPGCACDIPVHCYSFSFEPQSTWSNYFASQREILEYLEQCAKKHDILPHIHFHQKVTSTQWCEDGVWRIFTSKGQEFVASVLVSAIGVFQEPVIPKLQGFESYKGSWFHSSNWNHDVELEGKRVAVVGTSASGNESNQPTNSHLCLWPALCKNVSYIHTN